jgi:hypothetical protein
MCCDLLKVRHIYLEGRELVMKNEKLTSFWLDPWLGENPLCLTYPILCELCTDKTCSMFQVSQQEWVLNFSIRLPGIIRTQWHELAHKLNQVVLEESEDLVTRRWTASKQFLVKSVYEQLTKCDNGPSYKRFWKTKSLRKSRSLCGLSNKMLFS